VTAQTPDFAVGAKDSIRLKPKPAAAAKPAANAWLLAGDDLDGEELLDDEELLTEEDRQRPAGEGLGVSGFVVPNYVQQPVWRSSIGFCDAAAKGKAVQVQGVQASVGF
jgi:hypothetical protein